MTSNHRQCEGCGVIFVVTHLGKSHCSSKCRLRVFRDRHPAYYKEYKEKRNKTPLCTSELNPEADR